MLDSSPVALPPLPRPLKRSASTASLPTPPRTPRGKSRRSYDSDSEDGVSTSDDEVKKRRTGEAKQVNEDPLWLYEPVAGFNTEAKNQRSGSPPVTPKTRSTPGRGPFRDSPNNPFLATPENQVKDTPSPSDISANSSPHGLLQERPTIAYVFRGIRRECKNPLYNHAQSRPFSPPPESKLPIDHPDYSPAIHCTPKRLFADNLPKRKKKPTQESPSRKKTRQRSPSLSADESEIRPFKLNFGPG